MNTRQPTEPGSPNKLHALHLGIGSRPMTTIDEVKETGKVTGDFSLDIGGSVDDDQLRQ